MLKGLAGLAALGVGAGATRLLADPQDDRSGVPALSLVTHERSDLDSLEVAVDSSLVRQVTTGRWQSRRIRTSSFSMVAFIWPTATAQAPKVRAKVRRNGEWKAWLTLPPVHDVPAGDLAGDHTGTELVWVGESKGVQIEVLGPLPPGLKLVLLFPRRLPNDQSVQDTAPSARVPFGRATSSNAESAKVLRPTVLTRAQWGADESLRDGEPRYTHALRQAHVHHTASGNDYTEADVPGLIRGMYRYHTYNLGWSDIAYNFLVDRYGRIWEGRAGGIGRRVRGAHTLGFNTASVGIAVIGNFDLVQPSPAIVDGVARVAAWKLHKSGMSPESTVQVTSEGSDKFGPGKVISLPAIDGHRDTNDTACPGKNLYALLPQVRLRATEFITAATATPVSATTPPVLAGLAEVGHPLEVTPGTYNPAATSVTYNWMRNGQAIIGQSGTTYSVSADDLGAVLSVLVTASAPDRISSTTTLSSTPVVARPILATKARGGRGWVRVRVRVSSPAGLAVVPGGQVIVRLGRRAKVVDVVGGVARTRFDGVEGGSRTVRVRYRGDGVLAPAKARAAVSVL